MEVLTLTEEQADARESVLAHLALGARHVSLTGYAGTGKTTLAAQLVDELAVKGKVYACAPTHKAARVLEGKMCVETQTIHSFLGLQVVRDGRGGYTLRQKSNHELPSEGVVLLDESSMVGKQLWRFISNSAGLQWIFVGDPAQLPPVAEQPSPALSVPGARLASIVRQAAGNPILQVATRVRRGEPYLGAAAFEGDLGVIVTESSPAFAESALRGFKAQPPDRPPEVRVLAYRNLVVRHYNDRVRRMLHGSGKLPRFAPGDWLMMLDTYFEDQVPLVKNSEEVCVEYAVVDTLVTVGGFWKIWWVTVRREGDESATIPVLHEEEEHRFGQLLARYKGEAIDGARPWKDYYDLHERFAKCDYAFAMTVHKSQGSTFHTAYVDHRDLLTCRAEADRRALVYVAVTRPSHRLALLV